MKKLICALIVLAVSTAQAVTIHVDVANGDHRPQHGSLLTVLGQCGGCCYHVPGRHRDVNLL